MLGPPRAGLSSREGLTTLVTRQASDVVALFRAGERTLWASQEPYALG
jgi:hypothetical protein